MYDIYDLSAEDGGTYQPDWSLMDTGGFDMSGGGSIYDLPGYDIDWGMVDTGGFDMGSGNDISELPGYQVDWSMIDTGVGSGADGPDGPSIYDLPPAGSNSGAPAGNTGGSSGSSGSSGRGSGVSFPPVSTGGSGSGGTLGGGSKPATPASEVTAMTSALLKTILGTMKLPGTQAPAAGAAATATGGMFSLLLVGGAAWFVFRKVL